MADPVIDEIKQRVDLVDLIAQRVELKKAGRYFKGLCPFHREKTPSFVVYPDQGTYHCFGCGAAGDVFTWLRETEQLDFGEALRALAARTGVRLPERAAPPAAAEPPGAADALAEAAAWFHDQLLRAPEASPARQYLVQRGLKPETVARFGIGWAPDRWDALAQALRAKSLDEPALEAAGLIVRDDRGVRDRFRGRIIFPIRDAGGRVVGFGGRILGSGGDGQPKYLNSPQTAFFDKSATLYGLDLAKAAIRREGCAVIVEGYMDVVLPHQEGFANVVASLGTALTEQQLALLRHYTGTIVLALDADAAGQAATLRGLEVARQALAARRRPVPGPATRSGYLALSSGQIKIAVLAGGKDPDEIVRENPQAWQQLIASAVPMMEHKLAVELARVDQHDPQSKAAAVAELARFLVQVPDPIEWAHYIDVIAQRLRLDVRAVRDEVSRAARAWRQAEARAQRPARTPAAGSGSPVPQAPEASPAAAAPGPGSHPAAAGAGGPSPLPPAERRQRPAEREEPERDRTAGPALFGPARAEEVVEEHLVAQLALAPHLAAQLPVPLVPEELRRPECRELFRALLAGTPPPSLDNSLQGYYDAVLKRARQEPPQTDAQRLADLAGAARRIKERNLRDRLREAQYLLAETEVPNERLALERQVERLAAQLGRVQLERSRAILYPASPG
jgi:DNA primase